LVTTQRDDAQRQVDVEDVAPAETVHREPACQRADDARDTEDGTEISLVATALAGRYHVADDREREREQAAAADALQPAEGDQLEHVLRRSAERAGHQEHDDGELEDALAPVEVTGLAPQRRRGGTGQQVRGDHPGEQVAAVEIPHDRRQRRRDDRLVERGQEQA
jgi:hypothetical protein